MSIIELLIEKYQLQPHPEGGYFKEVYRSDQELNSSVHGETRNAVTHIYFLLTKGQLSRFHKVLHDEIWNFYEGDSLKLIEFDGENMVETVIGKENQSYMKVIKADVFQAAETIGDYTLVGCSVAPGFDFKDFSFLSENQQEVIKKQFSDYSRFI